MYSTAPSVLSDHELQALLAEDVPFGDLTTEALDIAERTGRIQFEARDPMIVCGIEEAARLFTLCGAQTELRMLSGHEAAPGTSLLMASGPAGALHRAWKSAQTLVEWCSGIASSAAEIQTAARRGHPDAIVAATRCTGPLHRLSPSPAGRGVGVRAPQVFWITMRGNLEA
jgi:molybdenum transport protein